jgi:hypothetical protein
MPPWKKHASPVPPISEASSSTSTTSSTSSSTINTMKPSSFHVVVRPRPVRMVGNITKNTSAELELPLKCHDRPLQYRTQLGEHAHSHMTSYHPSYNTFGTGTNSSSSSLVHHFSLAPFASHTLPMHNSHSSKDFHTWTPSFAPVIVTSSLVSDNPHEYHDFHHSYPPSSVTNKNHMNEHEKTAVNAMLSLRHSPTCFTAV